MDQLHQNKFEQLIDAGREFENANLACQEAIGEARSVWLNSDEVQAQYQSMKDSISILEQPLYRAQQAQREQVILSQRMQQLQKLISRLNSYQNLIDEERKRCCDELVKRVQNAEDKLLSIPSSGHVDGRENDPNQSNTPIRESSGAVLREHNQIQNIYQQPGSSAGGNAGPALGNVQQPQQQSKGSLKGTQNYNTSRRIITVEELATLHQSMTKRITVDMVNKVLQKLHKLADNNYRLMSAVSSKGKRELLAPTERNKAVELANEAKHNPQIIGYNRLLTDDDMKTALQMLSKNAFSGTSRNIVHILRHLNIINEVRSTSKHALPVVYVLK